MSSIKKIKSEVAAAISKCREHLGDVIGYTVRLGNAGVEPTALAEAFAREGLDKKWLPQSPTPERAFRRAVDESKRRFSNMAWAKLVDEPAGLGWGASARVEAEELGDVTSRLENRFLFLRVPVDGHKEGEVIADVEDEVADYLARAYEHHLAHYSRTDVVGTIRRCLSHWRAVPLAGWGQYFVTAEHSGEVRALARVVSGLGLSTFEALPLPKVAEAQKVIGSAARLALSEEIRELGEKVETWTNGSKNFKPDTLPRKLEEAAQLRERVEELRGLTKATTKDLEARLAEITGTVKTLVAIGGNDETSF